MPSLGYKTLMYKCNALSSFYATLVTCAVLHVSGVYRLTTIIEHFGEYMTVSMIAGYAVSAATYFHAVATNTTHRMSGNFAYDFFMGAALNPRIGSVDLKMWAEVRIPWVLLFLISVSGACKQYEVYGYVTPNMAFMVLATGLYINACGKGEECIPQTWDMFHEKWGFMVIFWNFAGVPFTYCYSIVYMAAHRRRTTSSARPRTCSCFRCCSLRALRVRLVDGAKVALPHAAAGHVQAPMDVPAVAVVDAQGPALPSDRARQRAAHRRLVAVPAQAQLHGRLDPGVPVGRHRRHALHHPLLLLGLLPRRAHPPLRTRL